LPTAPALSAGASHTFRSALLGTTGGDRAWPFDLICLPSSALELLGAIDDAPDDVPPRPRTTLAMGSVGEMLSASDSRSDPMRHLQVREHYAMDERAVNKQI
jgi:hypothetical protein